MTEFSPNFFVDAPPKMTRREQQRILGVKAVIAGLQDVVLPEPDPTTVSEIYEQLEFDLEPLHDSSPKAMWDKWIAHRGDLDA